MAKFRNVQEALQAIDDDAASKAWIYLEREAPKTAAAIQYLVVAAKWSARQIMDHFEETYGLTEEKTRHKIKLVVGALIAERDDVPN